MATYTFSFPASAAGLAVTVRNSGGSTVDTATAPAASGPQGAVVVTSDLPVGAYVAEAVNAGIFYTSRAAGVLDVPASLTGLAGRVADAVDPESVTFEADLIDALVAAGLMAEPA